MITAQNIKDRQSVIQATVKLYEDELTLLNQLAKVYAAPQYQDIRELERLCDKSEQHQQHQPKLNGDATSAIYDAIIAYCDENYQPNVPINVTMDTVPAPSTGTFYRAIEILKAKGILWKTKQLGFYYYHSKKKGTGHELNNHVQP